MRRRMIAHAGVALALAWGLSTSATGQARYEKSTKVGPGAKSWIAERAKLPPYEARRTPDGHPDLQGRWGGSSSGDDIEETENIDATTPAWESYVSNPPDGKIPYQPWAKAEHLKYRANLDRGWPGETGKRLYMDPQVFCLKSVPRYAQRGFELTQTPGYVTIMLNWGHYYRVIPTDNRPRPASKARFWLGISRGHWEGETLVVNVTNFNAKMWLDSVGNFVSENETLEERFTLVSANDLNYEVIITDPSVLTQPMTLTYRLRRGVQGGEGGAAGGAAAATKDPYAGESWEHACHEGNQRHVEGMRTLGFKWYPPVTVPAK